MIKNTAIAALSLIPLFMGCHSHTKTTTITRREETQIEGSSSSVRRDAANAESYIAAVQSAPTPAAEADAIRALHQWEVRNGCTYTIRARRNVDNGVVNEPSAGVEPVTATVTIYRGREVVRSFAFVPKDNRNLTLFGE